MFSEKRAPAETAQGPRDEISIGDAKKVVIDLKAKTNLGNAEKERLRSVLKTLDSNGDANVSDAELSQNTANKKDPMFFMVKAEMLGKLRMGQFNELIKAEPLKDEIEKLQKSSGPLDPEAAKRKAVDGALNAIKGK